VRYPTKYAPYLTLDEFDKFLGRYDMKLKEGSVEVSDTPLAKVLPDWSVDPKNAGITWLKRKIVRGHHTKYMPFRDVRDYYIRVGRSVQPQVDQHIALGRVYGLMWDTFGTNMKAWRFLEAAAKALRAYFAQEKLPIIPEALREAMMNKEGYLWGRAYRYNIDPALLVEHTPLDGPNIQKVQDMFLRGKSHPEASYLNFVWKEPIPAYDKESVHQNQDFELKPAPHVYDDWN